FLLIERAAGVGGTWHSNRYPGVGCDIPAELYSYSFRTRWPWRNRFASGAEIRAYLSACAGEPGLRERIRLGTEMRSADWDSARSLWRISTSRGTLRSRTLVLAAGRLSEPRPPGLAELGRFRGERMHSSEWPEGWSARGKRIGIVGTGASAIQLLPAVAREADATVLFQRTPAWVLPKGDRPLSPMIRALRASERGRRWRRQRLFRRAERGHPARVGVGPERERLTKTALAHLRAGISDPALRERLTPRYEIGCKRAVFSDEYYPALDTGSVLLAEAAVGCTEDGVVTASGEAVTGLDALIFATGFLAAEPPFAERVRGRDGLRLSEHWSEGMTALDTVAVSGFPNLFLLDGPNATLGHSSAVDMIEAQIGYVLGALALIGDSGVLEARAEAERASVRDLDELAAGTVWLNGGCQSWYLDPRSGRLTLIWPGTARAFQERFGSFRAAGYAMSHRVTPEAERVR
ncbi:flavin-containing monooxygenase, partial [Leucobacter sp. M11]|uniref:flavin-containing monooxygenase n=1 Tax=Leucobacter sp. M11 TaxID=2993565 RepID=UPI002D7E5367